MASVRLIPLSSESHEASHPIFNGNNIYRLSCVISALIIQLFLIQ